MSPTTSPAPPRGPRTRGPFFSPDGSRFWIATLDARHRIQIPKEIVQEFDWRTGDRLSWEVVSNGSKESLTVTNLDAIERKAMGTTRKEGAP